VEVGGTPRSYLRSALILSASAAAFVGACESSQGVPRGPSDSPLLVAAESLRLRESDSLYIGRIGGLYTSRSGDLYVSDLFLDRVLEFDAAGRIVRVFGQKGHGPGESADVGSIVAANDSAVAVADWGSGTLNIYASRGGRYLGSAYARGRATSAFFEGDSLVVGSIRSTEGARIDLYRLTYAPVTGEAEWKRGFELGLPPAYSSNSTVSGLYGLVSVLPWRDGYVVAFAADSLIRVCRDRGSCSSRSPFRPVCDAASPPISLIALPWKHGRSASCSR